MTDEIAKARDEQLMASMAVVLTLGHGIEAMSQDIRIVPTNGQFVVQTLGRDFGQGVPLVEAFTDVRSAVAHYLDLCDPA